MGIKVPDGMLSAATEAGINGEGMIAGGIIEVILEAALRWLSDNPIVPTDEQLAQMREKINKLGHDPRQPDFERFYSVEWQRRMFLALEPDVPDAIKELLISDESGKKAFFKPYIYNQAVLAAYRMGQKSVKL